MYDESLKKKKRRKGKSCPTNNLWRGRRALG
jgi:hypothetical protein